MSSPAFSFDSTLLDGKIICQIVVAPENRVREKETVTEICFAVSCRHTLEYDRILTTIATRCTQASSGAMVITISCLVSRGV